MLIKAITSWNAFTGYTSGVRCYAEADTQPETSPSGFIVWFTKKFAKILLEQ